MEENKIRPDKGDRESLYIKILMISTAAMFALVLAVFIFAGGVVRFSDGETAPPDITAGAEPDKPPIGEIRKYIPSSDSATMVMNSSALDAGYAVLVDLEENRIIASYRSEQRIFPASMTKIMTIIVACENIADLNEKFTITPDILNRAYTAGASRAGFEAGESVSMLDLLYGAALPSGADATDALAIHVAGSEEAFVVLMNEKAAALGLSATHFVNASGLHDDNHYSTVRDIAAIFAYAMNNEFILELMSAVSYKTSATPEHPNGITLYNNAFTRMSSKKFGQVNLIAAKTGFTDEGKHCLASFAVGADGKSYILVTAYGTDKYATVYDCKYAYETFIG